MEPLATGSLHPPKSTSKAGPGLPELSPMSLRTGDLNGNRTRYVCVCLYDFAFGVSVRAFVCRLCVVGTLLPAR